MWNKKTSWLCSSFKRSSATCYSWNASNNVFVPEGNQYSCFLWLKCKIINWGYTFCLTWIHLLLRYLCTKVFYIHMFLVKYKNSVLMLPYEAVQMKELFSFDITFVLKLFSPNFLLHEYIKKMLTRNKDLLSKRN